MFSDVFGMGMLEILLVGAVMLMLFSPKELPNMIKSIARLYGGLRRTADEFRNQIMETEELREIRGEYHRTRNEINSARDLAQRELNRAKLEALRSRKEVETTLKSGRSSIEGRVRREFDEAAAVAKDEAETPKAAGAPAIAREPRGDGRDDSEELHVIKADADADADASRDQGAA
ncbi:MAG: hypothetical protein KC468_26305 [Myxococcales bacterium]|nr:hypothetical protein [Myxococcales bacterium]